MCHQQLTSVAEEILSVISYKQRGKTKKVRLFLTKNIAGLTSALLLV